MNQRPQRPLGKLFPTQLLAFRRCPLSWKLRYIERRPFEETSTPALVLGNAVHHVTATLLRQPPEIWTQLTRDDAERLVVDRLPSEMTLSGVDRAEAVINGRDAVLSCTRSLDPEIEIVAVERSFDYHCKTLDRYGASLAARIDLLIRHPDSELELIDWKTGLEREDDALQAAISRMVVSSTYAEATRFGAPIRTTTHYTRTGTNTSMVLSRDQVSISWREVLGLVERMATIATEAKPGYHCQWCPFRGNGCTIPIVRPGGQPSVTCLGQVDPTPSC